MNAFVLVCGNVFDGISDALTGPAEILVEDNRIAKIERSVGRPPGARVIDLSPATPPKRCFVRNPFSPSEPFKSRTAEGTGFGSHSGCPEPEAVPATTPLCDN
jgi:hypothetical protein